MKMFFKIMTGAFATIGFLVVMAVFFFVLKSNGLLGRSDTFVGIDLDNDGDLSYPEWMNYYSYQNHSHPLDQCSRSDFYMADCDVDDRLSWREYHDFRFKHKNCSGNTTLKWASPIPGLDPQEREIAPPAIYALSSPGSRLPEVYRDRIRDQTQKLANRERELLEKYGLTRP